METKGKKDTPGRRRLQSDVDKMFLELLGTERTPRYGAAALRPNADVYYDDHEKAVVVRLEIPGIDPDAVSLEIEDNVLRVSGVRSDRLPAGAVYQQMEIGYGRFERAVLLPPEVEATKATASYTSGYLDIVLPIRSRSKGRRIPITPRDTQEGGLEE